MPPEVRHVLTILAVEHLKESVTFYRAAFDWRIDVETPHYVEMRVPGGQRFGLYQREGFGRNVGRTPAVIAEGELAPFELYLFSDDLDAAIERVRRAGARELSAKSLRPWGDEAAYFSDPSGNVLALARPAAQ